MAKIARERAVQEKRVRKQEKREERKQAAAEARADETSDGVVAPEPAEDEAPAA